MPAQCSRPAWPLEVPPGRGQATQVPGLIWTPCCSETRKPSHTVLEAIPSWELNFKRERKRERFPCSSRARGKQVPQRTLCRDEGGCLPRP